MNRRGFIRSVSALPLAIVATNKETSDEEFGVGYESRWALQGVEWSSLSDELKYAAEYMAFAAQNTMRMRALSNVKNPTLKFEWKATR